MASMPDTSTPFLHHPDAKDDTVRNGLICFLDRDRECGADCMAFGEPPEQPEYQGGQWANCMLLVNMHRGGKHLVVLAHIGTEVLKKQKATLADQARASQPAPPPVR